MTTILKSARTVSAALGKPDLPSPAGGFAASPAFDRTSPLTERLRAEHEAAMRDLYFGIDAPTLFDDVLAQIHGDEALLNV